MMMDASEEFNSIPEYPWKHDLYFSDYSDIEECLLAVSDNRNNC